MSARASASSPSSCSGAMYWKVPSTAPASVSGGLASVGALESWGGAPGASPVGAFDSVRSCSARPLLARPKSSSLAPDLVSMTLPGFRSR